MPFLANVDQIITFVCGVLGLVAVCAVVTWRLVVSYRFRGRLDFSDICVVTSLSVFLGIPILAFCGLEGAGEHVDDILATAGPETVQALYKLVYAYSPVWNVAFACSKFSALQSYAVILPVGHTTPVIQMAMAFALVAGLAGLFGGLCICQPASVFWTTHAWGRCGKVQLYYILMSVINLVVDLFVLALPTPAMWNLQIPFGLKKLVMGMFGCGLATVALAIWKLVVVSSWSLQDATHKFFLIVTLAGIEIALTISIACLPFLRAKWLKKQDKEGSTPSEISTQFARDIRAALNTNWDPPASDVHGIPGAVRSLSVSGSCVRDSYISTVATPASRKGHRRDDSGATCTNSIIVETTWEIKTEEHISTMPWPTSMQMAEWGGQLERCPTAVYEEGRDLPFLSGNASSSDLGESTVE